MLIFATHNQHKLEEVKSMLLPTTDLQSLTEIGFYDEIIEDGDSFRANAEIKSETIYQKTGKNVFGDDSGLVIPALGGAPGIYSARYAGTGKSEDNINKVLQKMEGVTERSAYFIAVICLMVNGEKYFFEGRVEGTISNEVRGKKGFGYDPIFQPEGYKKSFAELGDTVKNKISHRYRAIAKMKEFLDKNPHLRT